MTSDPDYAQLIDAETWAFIRETQGWYPPETATYPIERQRAIYDAMCRAFHKGYPEGVRALDRAFGGVPCREYTSGAATATVVYFHGGSFVVGGLESHDDVCADICAATGYRVISVDYRLAPENRHPAHFDDAWNATRAIAETCATPLVLAGDSAGGKLAAAVAHAARGTGPAIAGQVLIYPGLGGEMNSGSYLTHAHAPMLTRDDILFSETVRYADGVEPRNDPTAAPLTDTSFAGLPPTFVLGAECDPHCDDGRHYAEAIRNAGGLAHFVEERGLVHGYMRARKTVGRARDSFARITDGIRALGEGRFPWRVTL